MNMAQKTLVPPIKSQGIKTKLVPLIRDLVAQQDHARWLEPFMGTGVVGFNIARGNSLLADTNPHLIAFYRRLHSGEIDAAKVRAFLQSEGALLERNGESHYYAIRERFNRDHCSLDFLFLNRAGFNGMIRFNRKGAFNIPFCKKPSRFSKSYITKIVNQVAGPYPKR